MQTNLFPPSNFSEKDLWYVCRDAMQYLVMAGNPASAELLLRGLRHEDKLIRIDSMLALFHLNGWVHKSSIALLLQDNEPRVQATAAWVLACWGEAVPAKWLAWLPGNLHRWPLVEAFPDNWSGLFALEAALECIGHYCRSRAYWHAERTESEITALLQWLAASVDPQALISFLRSHRPGTFSEAYYGAWKLLQAQNTPLPLDILSEILSDYQEFAWETALLIGERGMAEATDLLNEMWAITDGRVHTAITIALDDLNVNDAVPILCSELQEKVSEATGALWGLEVLARRGRAIPQERLHQMLHHRNPELRAAAIETLSSLNAITLAEALEAVNDTRLEPVAASCHAFLALARTGIDVPTDLLVRRFVQLQTQQHNFNGGHYNGYVMWGAVRTFLDKLDELHVDIPLDSLVDVFTKGGEFFRLQIMRYWQRNVPDVYAGIIAQATAFLRQHL